MTRAPDTESVSYVNATPGNGQSLVDGFESSQHEKATDISAMSTGLENIQIFGDEAPLDNEMLEEGDENGHESGKFYFEMYINTVTLNCCKFIIIYFQQMLILLKMKPI